MDMDMEAMERGYGKEDMERIWKEDMDMSDLPRDVLLTPPPNLAKTLMLLGMRDENSSLRVLHGNQDVLKKIFDSVDLWYKLENSIIRDTTALMPFDNAIVWPEPTGLNINMMPIDLYNLHGSLPVECTPYRHIIQQIMSLRNAPAVAQMQFRCHRPHIAYLTIHEGPVTAGESQRRPGLHTETPGYIKYRWGTLNEDSEEVLWASWGGGAWFDGKLPVDGIFMASNIAHSCRAWDVQIDKPENVVRPGGDIEHMREHLGEGQFMEPNVWYWMTDTTPHESVALEQDGYRQYIRLVAGKVSAWYSDHSTANPLGIEPDAVVLKGNKFDDNPCLAYC